MVSKRHDENVCRVARFADSYPDFENETMHRRVEILNEARVPHLKSRKRPDGVKWTFNALRALWPRIRDELELIRDDDPVATD